MTYLESARGRTESEVLLLSLGTSLLVYLVVTRLVDGIWAFASLLASGPVAFVIVGEWIACGPRIRVFVVERFARRRATGVSHGEALGRIAVRRYDRVYGRIVAWLVAVGLLFAATAAGLFDVDLTDAAWALAFVPGVAALAVAWVVRRMALCDRWIERRAQRYASRWSPTTRDA